MAKYKMYFGNIVDILLPPRCFQCGEETALKGELCGNCWKTLKFITTPHCKCCGNPFGSDALEEDLCGGFFQNHPKYDRARFATKFDNQSRALIHGLKYGDKLGGQKM